jgi:hypothetical protein
VQGPGRLVRPADFDCISCRRIVDHYEANGRGWRAGEYLFVESLQ